MVNFQADRQGVKRIKSARIAMTVVRYASKSAKAPGKPAPELGKRDRNKLDKRARIRDAAWELFSELGFSNATTKAVAARAGVASGTLFLYARDKADLLFLVFHDRLRDTVEARFASMPRRGPLVAQLMHVFRGLFEMYTEQPSVAFEFVRVMPGADGPNASAVNAYTFAFLARVADLIDEARARGEVGDHVVPMQAASTIFALYYSALLGWLAGYTDRETALEQQLCGSLELLLRGMAARD